MKKFILLLSAIALFAACSKKDAKPALTPQTVTAADIMGKWQLVTDSLFYTNDGTTGIEVQDQTSENLFVTYGANGAGTQTSNGQTLPPFTYSVTGGKIHLVPSSGGEGDFIILAISTSRMVVRYTEDNYYEDAAFIKQ